MFSIIVAIGKNREIGKKNKLLWHIPEDLKNFKAITTGKTVIMGRKTFESIGRSLPNRKNIVLSKNGDKELVKEKGIEIYQNLEDLIRDYKNSQEEIFIIGGEQIYKEFLQKEQISRLYISYIDFSDCEADAYFPEINYENWKITEEKKYMYEKLDEISRIKPYKTEVNFICVKIKDELFSKGLNVKKLREKMMEEGILIRDASNFKFLDERFFRLAIKDRRSNDRVIEALKKILE